MDTQQGRHVVLEDTPSDLVTPPVLPVQMPATQTLPTVSHDHATVIPPMVTPVTVIEDHRSLATLPVGFRMPDIERYTGVGCPRIHLRLYSTRWYASLESSSSENLGGLSTGVSETEKAAEMIERPTERDQMSMFLRSLHPRYYSFPDTEGKELLDHLRAMEVCSADFQHRRPGYHPYARSLQIPRSDFPPLQHRHPHQFSSTLLHPHTVTVRPSFQFQRPQTSIPRHEQSRPHRRRQRTYSDLGMPLDRAFERLRSTGVLVPLAPRPLPSTLPPRFHAHEFVHFTRWQATVLIIVLLYCRDWSRAEIDGMMVMIFSEYIEIRLLQLSAPAAFLIHFIGYVDTTSTRLRGPPVVTVPQERFHPIDDVGDTFQICAPLSRVFETFQAMGFLAPLAPRALPDPVPPQFRLDLYCMYHQSVGHHTDRCTALRHAIQDIVDSGTFGHPQSDMFPIPTSAQAMHADAPSPAVPDLIDLGD
ncbi:hypothetical protein CK203_074433 [Vitis vinifera]|uniref:Retrotransposon gag domain-containing protein n=1 Tax=Vitis vinifera TaxID=29760 RepID=A0A438EH06_VITVI|nr:hypothetical protein CK203_074433 [Vitis vinifera]